MITGLRLENFKALKDANLKLGKITLLVGPNSSGKSSVIQALLAARLTARGATDHALVLSDGEDFDLGTFAEVVRVGAKPKNFAISFDVVRSATGRSLRYLNTRTPSAQAGVIRAEFQHLVKSREVYLAKLFTKATVVHKDSAYGLQVTAYPKIAGRERYAWTFTPGNETTQTFDLPRDDKRFFAFPDVYSYRGGKIRKLDSTAAATLALSADLFEYSLASDLRAIRHVGAMRAEPRRSYSLKGTRPPEVGRHGERAPDIVFSETRRKKSRERLMTGLNAALSQMGISKELTTRIPPGASAYSLVLDHLKPSVHVNIASVGFGVSQILPVLVETLHAPPGVLIALEQPEIHLHPRAQSLIADIVVESAMKESKRFIVETHSEQLIRKLQILVARKEHGLSAEDVRLYFFRPSEDGTDLIEMPMDETGRFTTEWPAGFFDESVNLSLEHLEVLSKTENAQ